MNYIAQCYCEEDRTDAKLLDGIRFSNECYELESIETVSETLRLDGSPEYRHEHGLFSDEKTALKFKILDHSIRQALHIILHFSMLYYTILYYVIAYYYSKSLFHIVLECHVASP